MKYIPKDITGQRFGKLVAICNTNEKTKKGNYKWMCQCDCGNTSIVSIENLRNSGGTRSCGCERGAPSAIPIQEYEEQKSFELSAHTEKWVYVRCYDRSKSKHIIKCVCCGTEKISYSFGNISECTVCQKEKEKQKKEMRKYKVCVQCGKDFYATRSTALYCCERCASSAYKERNIDKVRERRKTRKRLREAKATANGRVDYSITITRLIERDDHVCQLCGRLVDETDYVYINDAFVAGNNYPSIDHIKPLSKGGTHQWNNVQLAHRLCNSLKNNKEN